MAALPLVGCVGPAVAPPAQVPLAERAGEATISAGFRAPKPRHSLFVAGSYAATDSVRVGATVGGSFHHEDPDNEDAYNFEPIAAEMNAIDADLTIGLEQSAGRIRAGGFAGAGGGYLDANFIYCEATDSGSICYEAVLPISSAYLRLSAGGYVAVVGRSVRFVAGIRLGRLHYLSDIPDGQYETGPREIFSNPMLVPEVFSLLRLGSGRIRFDIGAKGSSREAPHLFFAVRIALSPWS